MNIAIDENVKPVMQPLRRIRERYAIPTIDDILTYLNQSQVFSKLDIKLAYHQIKLEPKCNENNYVSDTQKEISGIRD